MYSEQESGHTCNFNTAGRCVCGMELVLNLPMTTAPEPVVFPYVDPNPTIVNGGSPVGPGFVVYERKAGEYGYDEKMAVASVGPGWRGLIECLFSAIRHYSKWNPRLKWQDLVITQVKEKYGTLRIYWQVATQEQEGFIEALEAMSARICEACGHPGKVRSRPWILTLCDTCEALDERALSDKMSPTEQVPE